MASELERALAGSLGDTFAAFGRGVVRMGEVLVELILARTRQGEFLNAGAKTTYSARYARRKGKALSPVNLLDTGRMLGSLDVIAGEGERRGPGFNIGAQRAVNDLNQFAAFADQMDGQGVSVGFTDPVAAARYRFHGDAASPRTKMPLRQILGFTEGEADEMERVFRLESGTVQRGGQTQTFTTTITLGV